MPAPRGVLLLPPRPPPPGREPRRPPPPPGSLRHPLPEDRSAIQCSIGEVLLRIARNEIDPKRAGLLLYGLQIASLNLPPVPKKSTRDTYPVEEIVIDPQLGTLAPSIEVGNAQVPAERLSVVARLLRDTDPLFNEISGAPRPASGTWDSTASPGQPRIADAPAPENAAEPPQSSPEEQEILPTLQACQEIYRISCRHHAKPLRSSGPFHKKRGTSLKDATEATKSDLAVNGRGPVHCSDAAPGDTVRQPAGWRACCAPCRRTGRGNGRSSGMPAVDPEASPGGLGRLGQPDAGGRREVRQAAAWRPGPADAAVR